MEVTLGIWVNGKLTGLRRQECQARWVYIGPPAVFGGGAFDVTAAIKAATMLAPALAKIGSV
jgi:hypothetical protein